MDLQTLIPKWNKTTFHDKEAFDKWLDETTAYTVKFFDDGQDLLMFYVAENGEIIHAESGAMATIYNGSFIVEEPIEFYHVKIYNPKFQRAPYYMYKFQIMEVVTKKKQEKDASNNSPKEDNSHDNTHA